MSAIRQSCIANGVSDQTFRLWRREDPQLCEKLERAREKARFNALELIRKAGEAGDWRAAESYLRLSFFQDYRKDSAVTVNAFAGTANVEVSDEQRARLIELRQAALEDENSAAKPAADSQQSPYALNPRERAELVELGQAPEPKPREIPRLPVVIEKALDYRNTQRDTYERNELEEYLEQQ
jgi:hypothetical protein